MADWRLKQASGGLLVLTLLATGHLKRCYGWWWRSMVASNQHKQGDRDAVHPAIEWVSEYDWQKSFCNYREMTTEIIDILVAQEILTKLLPDKITDKDDDEIWWWNLKHTWMT